MEGIYAKIDDETKNKLNEYCKRTGMMKKSVVQFALEDYFNKNGL
jgi:antitoxin component of RelBE/YafQ-DinJ toxin-antitoxin module